jgi:hypothetical protein
VLLLNVPGPGMGGAAFGQAVQEPATTDSCNASSAAMLSKFCGALLFVGKL